MAIDQTRQLEAVAQIDDRVAGRRLDEAGTAVIFPSFTRIETLRRGAFPASEVFADFSAGFNGDCACARLAARASHVMIVWINEPGSK